MINFLIANNFLCINYDYKCINKSYGTFVSLFYCIFSTKITLPKLFVFSKRN